MSRTASIAGAIRSRSASATLAPAAHEPKSGESLLRCQAVDVSFGEVAVLKAVSLEIFRGESHVLIGPNGAGKTTLANAITGHVQAGGGTIEFCRRPLRGASWRRARRGIARKFQVPRVFPRLDAVENLELAGAADEEKARGASELGSAAADQLSHGQKQWLELRMALARRPLLAVLDEPTAGMTREERNTLAAQIRQLRGEVTFLVVEHDLDFVALAADRVSFLHQGELLLTGSFAEVQADPTVRSVYLGNEAE